MSNDLIGILSSDSELLGKLEGVTIVRHYASGTISSPGSTESVNLPFKPSVVVVYAATNTTTNFGTSFVRETSTHYLVFALRSDKSAAYMAALRTGTTNTSCVLRTTTYFEIVLGDNGFTLKCKNTDAAGYLRGKSYYYRAFA